MRTLPEVIEKIEKSKAEAEFLPTGFHSLDEYLDGGFMRKELVVLGAYTGVGKSYVAGQMFWNVAQKGFKCGYFSLEISAETVVSRLMGALANIKPTRIVAGLLTEDEFEEKLEAKAKLLAYQNFMYFYDDIYKLELIEKEAKENGYEFIVIDFIQNVLYQGKDEYERLSKISLALQKLAKDTNSCILALSQLSNEAAKHNYMEFKGSGSIATVCDLGIFLKRSDPENNENWIELLVKKNRRGFSGGKINLIFKQPGGWIV